MSLLLAHTLVKRWYLFVFLGVYLCASLRRVGWRRTLVHLVVTIGVMTIFEEIGTQTGLPFGKYHYETKGNDDELWLGRVLFVSVLSWPFFTYAGWAMAQWVRGGGKGRGLAVPVLLATAFLLMLDVIVDPVAARGERWFLGRFHVWDEPGLVFGVPWQNFAGWGLGLILMFTLWQTFDRRLAPLGSPATFDPLGIALYAGLWLFNLSVAFAIGAWDVGLTGLAILCAQALVIWRKGSI